MTTYSAHSWEAVIFLRYFATYVAQALRRLFSNPEIRILLRANKHFRRHIQSDELRTPPAQNRTDSSLWPPEGPKLSARSESKFKSSNNNNNKKNQPGGHLNSLKKSHPHTNSWKVNTCRERTNLALANVRKLDQHWRPRQRHHWAYFVSHRRHSHNSHLAKLRDACRRSINQLITLETELAGNHKRREQQEPKSDHLGISTPKIPELPNTRWLHSPSSGHPDQSTSFWPGVHPNICP